MKFKSSLFQENLALTDKSQNSLLNDFIRQLDLTNPKIKKIEAMISGLFQSLVYGSGFDFNEIREYKIGDDLRHISWKTTAKTGNLHTKEYFAEKEIRVYFLIDISNSMFFGNKLEPFIKLFALLLNLVKGYSEKIGGVYFSEDIKYNFPPRESRSQSNIMFQTFFNYYHKLRNTQASQTSTNIFKAVNFTKEFFKKRGYVFIISDFINLQNFEKGIYELSKSQNVYIFQIYDPIDFNLAKAGYISFTDPETTKKIIVNTDSSKIIQTYNTLMNEKQKKLTTFFMSTGIKHITVEKSYFNQ